MKLVKIEFKDLAKANAYAKSVNEAYEAIVAELTAERTKAEGLQKALDAAGDESGVNTLKSELEEANALILDLGSQLEALSAISQADKRVVEIKGKKVYLEGTEFIVPGRGPMSADQLAADKTLLEELYAKGSSIFSEITK